VDQFLQVGLEVLPTLIPLGDVTPSKSTVVDLGRVGSGPNRDSVSLNLHHNIYNIDSERRITIILLLYLSTTHS